MKRLWFAVAFLLIAVSLCVFEQYTVNKTYNNLTSLLDSAEKYAENDDFKSAEDSCKKMETIWKKEYPFLTSMIEHTSLDDTEVTLLSLAHLAKLEEKEELLAAITDANHMLESIYRNQKPSFGNIF